MVVVTECHHALERFADRHRGDRLINRRPVLDALGYADVEDHTTATLERMRLVATQVRTAYDVPVLTVHSDHGYDPDLEAIVDFVTA